MRRMPGILMLLYYLCSSSTATRLPRLLQSCGLTGSQTGTAFLLRWQLSCLAMSASELPAPRDFMQGCRYIPSKLYAPVEATGLMLHWCLMTLHNVGWLQRTRDGATAESRISELAGDVKRSWFSARDTGATHPHG